MDQMFHYATISAYFEKTRGIDVRVSFTATVQARSKEPFTEAALSVLRAGASASGDPDAWNSTGGIAVPWRAVPALALVDMRKRVGSLGIDVRSFSLACGDEASTAGMEPA